MSLQISSLKSQIANCSREIAAPALEPRLLLGAAAILLLAASAPAQPFLEHRDDFASDPRWESFSLVPLPKQFPITRQDFGWRAPPRAATGEIGGWVQRSVTPASYAKVIDPRSLEDKLRASGKFAVRRDTGSSGTLFGWFNENSRGWRTPNSLVFRIDGNGSKFWVFFEYGTRHWLSGGGGCFEGERYQTTPTKPFPANGAVHTWSLEYDPLGSNGKGLVTFTLDGKSYTRALDPGHKNDGALFNRFGILNQQIFGGGMEVWFGDLVIDGERVDLRRDPGWEAHRNHAEFEERAIRPLNDFGFRPTAKAGGKPGEVGGIFWRDERPAYCAARVDPLSLKDTLSASGRLAFCGAGSDSGIYLGWFDSNSKTNKSKPDHEEPQRNLLAIHIEGPSRIGHYFLPVCRNADGQGAVVPSGPIIYPDGRVHQWSLRYLPQAAEGRGQIVVTFDDRTQTLALPPGFKQRGAQFDRFGFFNAQTGGHWLELYVDDLTYTAKGVK